MLTNLFAKVSKFIPTLRWLRLDESMQQFAVFMISQVDLVREAANLSRFNYNFRRCKDVSFPKPLYPLVHPAVLVETYEHGESILPYADEIEGHKHIKTALVHIGTHALLKMLLEKGKYCFNFFKNKGKKKNMEPLFCIEHHYMPKEDYSNRFNDYQRGIARNEISRCLSNHYTDEVTFYRAMNYFDRFVSRCSLEEFSRELESEAMIRTSAICCLIFASKMTTPPDFLLSGFLMSRNLVQSINRIRETEYLILKVLDWRMQPITALSFLCVFIENLTLYDPQWMIRPAILQNKAIANICYSQSTIKLTEFRPSVIAPAAIIIAWMTNYRVSYQEVCIAKMSFGNHYEYLHQQGLKQCVLLMIDKMGLRVPGEDVSVGCAVSFKCS